MVQGKKWLGILLVGESNVSSGFVRVYLLWGWLVTFGIILSSWWEETRLHYHLHRNVRVSWTPIILHYCRCG